MFKCKFKYLFLVLLLANCATSQRGSSVLIDVEKACGENIQLVQKLMNMDFNHFKVQKSFGPKWSAEKTYDLNSNNASEYGLDWMQIKFEYDKLQSIWFGKRSELEDDLMAVGLRSERMKTKDNMPLTDFSSGTFYIESLSGQMIKVEHEGAPVKGTLVTCFELKNKY